MQRWQKLCALLCLGISDIVAKSCDNGKGCGQELGHGRCDVSLNGHVCICNAGFKGADCMTAIDPSGPSLDHPVDGLTSILPVQAEPIPGNEPMPGNASASKKRVRPSSSNDTFKLVIIIVIGLLALVSTASACFLRNRYNTLIRYHKLKQLAEIDTELEMDLEMDEY